MGPLRTCLPPTLAGLCPVCLTIVCNCVSEEQAECELFAEWGEAFALRLHRYRHNNRRLHPHGARARLLASDKRERENGRRDIQWDEPRECDKIMIILLRRVVYSRQSWSADELVPRADRTASIFFSTRTVVAIYPCDLNTPNARRHVTAAQAETSFVVRSQIYACTSDGQRRRKW